MNILIQRLRKHEGLSLEPYPDGDGWSVGYGHWTPEKPTGPIAMHKAEELLKADAYHASDRFLPWKREHCPKLNATRGRVCVELIFWHGFKGFLKFKRLITAIEKQDWQAAADEMMDSDSGRKYETRMSELADIMRGVG